MGDLQLCPEVLTGLKRLGNPALLSEDVFSKLLEAAVGNLIQSSHKLNHVADIASAKGDIVKEAYTALMVVLVEATRYNASNDQVMKILRNLSWPTSRSNCVTQLYSNKKIELQAALARCGSHPPHVVDVHWQLNYCVKSNVNEHSASPIVLVQLVTEGAKCEEQVKFSCTISELQDLQAKLKEALRHIDHIGQQSS